MLQMFVRMGDGTEHAGEADAKLLAAALRDPEARFWLDMEAPDDEEVSLLDELFGFHPLAIEDTISYQQRPKIESYNHVGDMHRQGYFYLVIHGPDLNAFREDMRTKELDMFISEHYLVTVHDEPMMSVDTLRRRAMSDPGRVMEAGIDMLLYGVLDQLVDHYMPILDHFQEQLEQLEENAIDNPSPSLLTDISRRKRELLNMRRIIGPQRDVLGQLTRGEVPFIRESTRVYLRDVQDHLTRAVELIELYRELVMGARDLYLSSVNNNLNKVMKTLTTISVIALPLTVITSFFGMNFDSLPGIHSRIGLIVAVGLMVAFVVILLTLFRRNHWI